jgi:hypothetical protein
MCIKPTYSHIPHTHIQVIGNVLAYASITIIDTYHNNRHKEGTIYYILYTIYYIQYTIQYRLYTNTLIHYTIYYTLKLTLTLTLTRNT